MVLTVFYVPAHKALTLPSNQEAYALARVQALANDPSEYTADWMHRKSGYLSARVEWHSAKDAELPLKYGDLVNMVPACPMCSKQHPRQVLKDSRAIHQSSQTVRNW